LMLQTHSKHLAYHKWEGSYKAQKVIVLIFQIVVQRNLFKRDCQKKNFFLAARIPAC
jgi:hypothetical protein